MYSVLRTIGIAAATAIVIAGSTVAFPDLAAAGGGHHGGHHGGGHWGGGYGGWGWGGIGWGLATGMAYGGYYGGPYAYDYGYGGECYIRRHWVINRYGQRVLRRIQVCY